VSGELDQAKVAKRQRLEHRQQQQHAAQELLKPQRPYHAPPQQHSRSRRPPQGRSTDALIVPRAE
jgi:hypothetical protein